MKLLFKETTVLAYSEDFKSFREAKIIDIKHDELGPKYYVHYNNFNKRLDEWIRENRIKSVLNQQRNSELNEQPCNNREIRRLVYDAGPEKEEKDCPEVNLIKNFDYLVMGSAKMQPWYFSPYPEEIVNKGIVYICDMCLSYKKSETCLRRHVLKCNVKHPPGKEIYRNKGESIFEIDGRVYETYCQNLCLLAKCFLDHKNVNFDTTPFLFYVFTKLTKYGNSIAGYFSKSKKPEQNFNLACILTLPQYQKQGIGWTLIDFSYMLSRIENKKGSPEKPLSDLGLLSYKTYWSEVIIEHLFRCLNDKKRVDRPSITIKELSDLTFIDEDDVKFTLTELQILHDLRGTMSIIINPEKLDTFYKSLLKRNRIHEQNVYYRPTDWSKRKKI